MEFGSWRLDDVTRRGLPNDYWAYLYRTLCVLCALAAVWAVVVLVTGGMRVRLGALQLSSRRPGNPAAIALLSGLLVWLLTFAPGGREALRREWVHWRGSASLWRRRARHIIHTVSSPFTIAAAAIAIDIYQWSVALPLWVDEEMIAINIRDRSLSELTGTLWLGQSAPFGWLVLERAAMSMMGTGEAALRAVPLLFGIATVGASVWIARRWMGRIAAVVFVLLCWIGQWLSHFRFEVKHYSADVLFGLLLPAIAAWAIEAETPSIRMRRAWLWWVAAAIGQWCSNGALLVTPACALFMCVILWRRDGRRGALWFAVGGWMWLASFGAHYLIAVRYTLNNAYLQSTWQAEMLPRTLGVTGSLQWFLNRLEPLAFNPGGTSLWIILWTSAICGWAFGATRSLGVMLAGVPLSAFACAAVVPLHQRFSVWMVPALYTGVALLVDRAVRLGGDAFRRRRWALLTVAALVLFVEFQLVSDIVGRGRVEVDLRRLATDKHRLDDRAAVKWLMSQWQPGDVVVTTHLGLPAVWWYWGLPISDAAGSGGVLPDGSPIYEADFAGCRSGQFAGALRNHQRVLLYLGFDHIPAFDHALLRNLSALGGVAAAADFATLGRVAVIDLRMPASELVMQLRRTPMDEPVGRGGCVALRPAQRW